jgi:transcriptional regulator with XRE-family HTH domain
MAKTEAGAMHKSPLGSARRSQDTPRDAISPRKPTAVDRHVGKRLRLLRQIREVSMEKLAEIVDVAPQQIQKYEVGETRISASRIFELSKIFNVPLSWFYDDLHTAASAEMDARIRHFEAPATRAEPHMNGAAETSQEELLVAYYALLTPEMRKKLIDIARMLSEVAVKQAR